MTISEIVELLQAEQLCVIRQNTPVCKRETAGCAKCDLVQNDKTLDAMYSDTIFMLRQLDGIRSEYDAYHYDSDYWRGIKYVLDCLGIKHTR